ncbi:MAG TPA: FtsX-like permease family protein [Ktedonobacteraceae bacterium]|nr:FtsX-like permease family protein [Ktedonobacteraceae bacterium]
MSRSSNTRRPARRGFSLTSNLILAFAGLRRTSFLMGIITLGMVAAIVIVCVVPAFTSVMNTAGLRSMLASNTANGEIEITASALGISSNVRNEVSHDFLQLFQQNMTSTYQVLHETQTSLISTDFTFRSSPPHMVRTLVMQGVETTEAAGRLGKLQGHLPTTASSLTQVEVMISAATAKALQLKLGDTVPLSFNYYASPYDPNGSQVPKQGTLQLTAVVAGIFAGDARQATYWHGSDFNPLSTLASDGKTTLMTTSMLLPNESLLYLADQLANQNRTDAIFSVNSVVTMRWYYQMDISHISIDDLNGMLNDVANLQSGYLASFGQTDELALFGRPSFPYLTRTALTSQLFTQGETTGALTLFQQRVDVSRLSAVVLAVQIILLVLFFVSLITNLLVDRQSETIAVMRGRGASRGQIFGVLITQCLVQGLLSFIIGVPLAIGAVFYLVRRNLGGADLNALNVLTDHLLQTVETNMLYALGILLVVLIAMSVQLFFAVRVDVLALRRQSARNNRSPLWQRWNLDVIAGTLALLSYGISLYLTSINDVLQGDARALILAPLSVIAPFFLIIGCLLFFLRVFPLLLRLASRLVSRGKGAVPMLALAQISRAPRQPMRMTMLLALATAFTLFTLIYSASESYHLQQMATYMTGADFSGRLDVNASVVNLSKAEQPFLKVNGVLSTTAGYATEAIAGKGAIPIEFRAVDATNYTSTVVWPSQTEQQTGGKLLADLVKLRQTVGSSNPIPAIVDTITATHLRLGVGATFTVTLANQNVKTLTYQILGVVPYLPTVNNRLNVTRSSTAPTPGGVLVDYATFSKVYTKAAAVAKQTPAEKNNPFFTTVPPSINTIWLHTRSEATSLAAVRIALTKTPTRLFNIADRWQMLANLTDDPLYLVLGGVLGIGTITALLLALVGDLLASWLSARTRLLNFAIVRALGSTPGEVAGMLMWEQVIIYVSGLALGALFGWMLSASMIPALTFTDLHTNVGSSQFYNLQTAFPVQVVMPPSLLAGILALVALFILALALSVRVVSRPALGAALRLNED